VGIPGGLVQGNTGAAGQPDASSQGFRLKVFLYSEKIRVAAQLRLEVKLTGQRYSNSYNSLSFVRDWGMGVSDNSTQ
jgi:hypothetical protein